MSSGESGSRWSLATRLTVWYAASAFLLVAIATGLLYWVLARNVVRDDDEFIADTVRILRALMRERPGDEAAMRQEVEWEGGARRYTRVFICIFDDSRRILMETPGSSALMKSLAVAAAAVDQEPDTTVDFLTPGILAGQRIEDILRDIHHATGNEEQSRRADGADEADVEGTDG